jgi:hypothetical protein
MEPWEELGRSHMSPETLIAEAMQRPQSKKIYTSLIGLLKDMYLDAGYGWDTANLWNRPAWQAERRHFGKNARKNLFPSYFFQLGRMQSHGHNLSQQAHASENRLSVSTLKRRMEEEQQRAQREAEKNQSLTASGSVSVRIDPAQAKSMEAMKFLERLKDAKRNLPKETWDAVIDDTWIRFTPEKFQNEVWSSLSSEQREEMLALIPVHHCHRLGIGEAKREAIRRMMETA